MSLMRMELAGFQGGAAQPVHSWEDDAAYHRRRAEEELQTAQAAESPETRRFHYHLAALHLDRAHAQTQTSWAA